MISPLTVAMAAGRQPRTLVAVSEMLFRVDRYEVYDAIASGGMASVHLGRLVGVVGFGKTVAIKRIHQQFVNDQAFVEMFVNEAHLTSRVRHPNVVPILDAVATPRELLLVMEYIRGESLSTLIAQCRRAARPMGPSVAAAIVAQALRGLHAAHEAVGLNAERLELVHRDVSPQNLAVGLDGVVRVLDFGIAKSLSTASDSTREGSLKGKLRYMAPEQFSREVSRHVDIYAAGVVLWEALTLARLFDGATEAEVVMQVLDGAIPPPSSKCRDVTPALDALVSKALARSPDDRFTTALAMAEALERTVQVASAAEVGAWATSLAGEGLRQRDLLVAAIDAASSDHTLRARTASTFGAAPAVTLSDVTAPPSEAWSEGTQASPAVAGARVIPTPLARRRRPLLALGVATLAGLGVAAAVGLRSSNGARLSSESPVSAVPVSPASQASQAPATSDEPWVPPPPASFTAAPPKATRPSEPRDGGTASAPRRSSLPPAATMTPTPPKSAPPPPVTAPKFIAF